MLVATRERDYDRRVSGTADPMDAVIRRRLRPWIWVATPLVVFGIFGFAWARELTIPVHTLVLILIWGGCFAWPSPSAWAKWIAYACAAALAITGSPLVGLFVATVIEMSTTHELERALGLTAVLTALAWIGPLTAGSPPPLPGPAAPIIGPIAFAFAFGVTLRSAIVAFYRADRLAADLADTNETLARNLDFADELAATRERARIARDLHDSLGHCLTTAHVHLELAEAAGDPDTVRDAVAKAHRATLEGLGELRRCVTVLRDETTVKPLEQLARDFLDGIASERVRVTFEVRGERCRLSPAKDFALFRALQEAVTNATRHAEASEVSVCLAYSDDGRVELSVRDDGQGAADTEGGYGLLGLRERLELVGGELTIDTHPGRGFALSATVS